MWAQAPVNTTLWEETWTGGSANQTPSVYQFGGTTVYGDATLTYTQSSDNTKLYAEELAGGTSPELLLSKSNKTWTISGIPTGQAVEMSLTFKSNKSTFAITSSTDDISIDGSGTSWTISNKGDVETFDLTIKNTGSSNARIDDIVLTVTTAGSGGGSDLTNSDLALTNAQEALEFDLYNDFGAKVINYTTSSTGAVTVSDNDYVTTAVDQKNQTITVTPKTSVTPAAQTITVSQKADESYKAGSATFTVNITDSTPIPTYTVTLGDDSSTLTEETGGAGVILPSRDALNGYTFVGWSEENVSTETTEAPVIIAAGAYAPTTDVTLYPVYSKTVGGGGSTNEAADVTISEYASANKWTNGTAFQPLIMDANISVGGEISGNNFKYYSSDNSWRFYSGGSFTISASNDATLSSVTLTFSSGGALSYNSKSITSGTAFDVEGTSAEINSSATTKITAISVNYTIAGSGTTYYCSTPVSKADPELSFSETSVNGAIGTEFTAPTLNAADGFNGTVWYESSDESVAQIMDDETGELRLVGEGTATITATFDGNNTFQPGAASYTLTVTDNRIATTTFVEDIELDLTEVETLTQLNPVVKDAEDNIIDCTYEEFPPKVSYEIVSDDNYIIGSIDNNSGEITLNEAVGTAILKASYNAYNVSNTYKPSECTFTISVIDTHAPGAVNNPYSVAEAIDAIDASTGVTGVYAKGIVSEIVTAYNSTYGNISYNISADGSTDGAQLQAFRGKSYNGENFTSANDIQVGDEVVIFGNLIKYNTTYEFAQDNQLVSRKTTPALAFGQESYEVVVEEEELTITASSKNSEGAITYTSSNTDVADIDAETGEVQAYAAGTTTITATIAATETYRSYSVDVLLTVTDGRAAVNITEVTAEQTSIVVGNVTNAVVTNDQENWTAAYTFTSDNEEVAMVDETTGEILAISKGTANITATLNVDPEDENYIEGNVNSMSFVITVVNPSHTAHFSFNGTVDNNNDVLVEEGEAIAFPSIDIPDGYLLIGWAAEAVDGFVFEAPETITNAVMGNKDVTYYAVLAAGKMAKTTDKLDYSFTGLSGTGYTAWSGKKGNSGAVYAGQSNGNNSNVIQLRTTNSNSGIVSTTSGGKVTKVTVEWNSQSSRKTMDVYGSNTPYESASDLFDGKKQGTKIGSIAYDTDTKVLNVDGDYAYIGVRSASGAIYLQSISFTWENPEYDGYCSVTPTKVEMSEADGYTDSQEYAIVKLDRTVKADTWSSFTVPFDIPEEQIPGFITIKKLTSTSLNGEYVTLNFTDANSIEAGVPYMIRSTMAFSNIKVYGVDVDSELNNVETDYAVMKGNMTPMNVPVGAFFISNNTWYEAEAGENRAVGMKAFRAYIELTEKAQSAGARGFEMDIDGEVTRIDTVSQSGNAQFNGTAYDLQGRRVEKPARGLYIVNGKKVLVK